MNDEEQLKNLIDKVKEQENKIDLLVSKMDNIEKVFESILDQIAQNHELFVDEDSSTEGNFDKIITELDKHDMALEDISELVIFSDRIFREDFKIEPDAYHPQFIIPESNMVFYKNVIEKLVNLTNVVLKGVALDVPIAKIFKIIPELEIHTHLDNLTNLHLTQFQAITCLRLFNAQFKREGYELASISTFNYVSSLPDELKNLTKLKRLTIEMPFLRNIPDIFSNMNELEFMEIENSSISTLPPSFYRLPKLRNATIHSFQLIKIMDLTAMKELNRMEYCFNELNWRTGDFHKKKIPFNDVKNLDLSMFPENLAFFYCFLYNYEHYVKGMLLEPLYTNNEMIELRKKFTRKLIIQKDAALQAYYYNDLITFYCDDFPEYLNELTNIKELGLLDKDIKVSIPDSILKLKNLEIIYTDLNVKNLEMSEEVKKYVLPKITSFGDKRNNHLVSWGPFLIVD